MRLFVAVFLDEPLQEAVAAFQRSLIAACPTARHSVKWVEPHNLHFTLKFIGEVGADRLVEVADAVRRAVRGGPFEVTIEGLGAFPGLRNPRVLWIGVTEGAGRLVALARAVEDALAGVGFPREARPFEPHLTIGRVRGGRDLKGLAQVLERVGDAKIGRQPVRSVAVVQSELGPRGPTYTVREAVALGG